MLRCKRQKWRWRVEAETTKTLHDLQGIKRGSPGQDPFHKLSNKPPPITPNILSNRDLAVSAAESIYFCLLVGDYVCETCNVWKYYLSLKDLVDFILMKSFSIRQIPQLESIIAEHNSLYMTIDYVQNKSEA